MKPLKNRRMNTPTELTWLDDLETIWHFSSLFTEIVADVVGCDMAPCHVPCNNPSVPPMWIFNNIHHRRFYRLVKLIEIKVGIKCISRSTFTPSNMLFDTIWCEYLSSRTRPCQRLLLPACVLSLRWGLTVRYLLVSNLFVTIHQLVTCHTLSGLTSHDIINFSFQ